MSRNKRVFVTLICLAMASMLAGCPDLKKPEAPKETPETTSYTPSDQWIEGFLDAEKVRTTPVSADSVPSEIKDPEALLSALDEEIKTLAAFVEKKPERAQVESLMKRLDQGVEAARKLNRDERVGAYYVALALLRDHLGYGRTAVSACRETADLLEKDNKTVWPTVARQIRGDISLKSGDVKDALAQYEIAFGLAAARRDWRRASGLFRRIPVVLGDQANEEKVKEAVKERRALLAKRPSPKGEGVADYWDAEISFSKKQNEEGINLLYKADAEFRKSGSDEWRFMTALRLAEILQLEGQPRLGDATTSAREALLLAQTVRDRESEVNLYLHLGALLERDWNWENAEEALACYRKAYWCSVDNGLKSLEIESLNYLGLGLRNRKNTEMGLACILEAMEQLAKTTSDPNLAQKLDSTYGKISESFPDKTEFEQYESSVLARKSLLVKEATRM